MAKNILGLFLEKLLDFPLWVKQIVYLRLYQNLALSLSEDFINVKEEDIFHLHVPELSFVGKTEMVDRRGGHDSNTYNFLSHVNDGLSMVEISMNNFWTLEEVAKYYMLCLENNYIKTPASQYIYAMAGFMSGKFRTGEYFKRIGKIDVNQLEQTILKQKEYAQSGDQHKMAEIMISLGYITENDSASLLMIKEEAKKRFILDLGILPKEIQTPSSDLKAYQNEITALKEKNTLLMEKLTKIMSYIKKND